MKIMQISPFALPIKHEIGYGGIERIIRDLDRKFVEFGLDSYVIAIKGSETFGKLCEVDIDSSFKSPKKNKLVDNFEKYSKNVVDLIKKLKPDIVHDHLGVVKSKAFKYEKSLPPTLFTLHGPVNDNDKVVLGNIDKQNPDKRVLFNSISNSQQDYFNRITSVDFMVYNGIYVPDYPYNDSPKNFIFSWSLINPKKGTHISLDVAKKLNKKIVVAGPVHDFNKKVLDYWSAVVKPRLDFVETSEIPPKKIPDYLDNFLKSNLNSVYIGEVNDSQTKEWVKRAEAFYFPIKWQEPFGLVTIESLACGTPVVAYSGGALKEVMVDGKTGYVVQQGDFEKFVKKASEIYKISRKECRKHVEDNFSTTKMALSYLAVYKQILNS